MRTLGYDRSLADDRAVAAALVGAGMAQATAGAKTALFRRAAEAIGVREQSPALFVPGRVEVLGKHTDYAGGRSMVIAAEQGFAVVLRPREDRRMIVRAVDRNETAEFELDPELVPRLGHWSNYPMTVGRRVARNFAGDLRGAEIALASDLPPAAGMSSSSAMIVGMFLAVDAINRLAEQPAYRENIASAVDLAGYLGTIENGQTFGSLAGDRGVGTFGGSEDHTAILCGLPGQVSQYSYCPVRFERAVAIPSTHALAIASSGVVAEKTGGALELYNAASRSAAALAELWRESTGRDEPHLGAIVASSPDAPERLRQIVCRSKRDDFSPELLAARLEQFVAESQEIIPRVGDALAAGDLAAFGAEVDRSQQGAERLLRNQVPQTVFLAASARRLGAAAASAFGAGFGGSVWALVERTAIETFLDQWQAAYVREFPDQAAAEFFPTLAGPAAFRLA